MLWNAKNGCVTIGETDMHYVRFGRGEKVLVILPGLSDGLTTVKGKALLLAKPYRRFFAQYTVYVFSRKNRMPEHYSIREMAADQAAALDALSVKKSRVMGVSQGGMIAQYLAIDCPNFVEKLVLAVSAPCANDRIRSCVGAWIEMAQQGDHRRLMIDTAEKSYSEARLKAMRPLYPILGLVGKPGSYGRFLINAGAILSFDALNELGRIACPTLIIGGAEDKIVGVEASYALRDRIVNSVLHVYPGLGHAAYEEAPDFNEQVYRFLESSDGPAAGCG